MNTLEIKSYLSKLNCHTKVCCLDAIPKNISRRPYGIIVNTDKCKDPGEHWVSIWLSKNGCGEYFDSFGLPPLLPEILDVLNKYCDQGWIYNCVQLQSVTSQACGQYCIAYMKWKCQNKSLDDFIASFNGNEMPNDEKISKMFIETT